MMPKRKLLREFAHEVIHSKYRLLVVEGYSDKRFYEAWASSRGFGEKLAAVCVDSLEIPTSLLDSKGLNDSNRSRVLAVCWEFDRVSDRFRGLLDRDTGAYLDSSLPSCLLVTDYPAIESYVLDEQVFHPINGVLFCERFGSTSSLLSGMAVALRDLWEIRTKNPHLARPNFKSGMKNAKHVADFDARAATGIRDIHLPSEVGYSGQDYDDIRLFAYGHDIAALIFELDQNFFKNKLKYGGPEPIEASFMASMAVSPRIDRESLFVELANWLEA